MTALPAVLALLTASIGLLTDLRTRRIPNWLTASALVGGLLVNLLVGGPPGVLSALEGAGLGFALLILAARQGELWLLMIASAIEVTGFALMTPSLQSLISRRSDPAKQGGILGVSQSTSSLARVVGPLIAVPLFFKSPPLPYWAAVGIMAVSTAIFVLFARKGKDYVAGPVELSLPAEALE